MAVSFTDKLYSFVAKIPFDTLIWAIWGSYAAVFLVCFILTAFSQRFKTASKRPYLCLTNAYAGVNLAAFLLKCGFAQSVLITVLFWVIAYILYGLLCFISRKKEVPSAPTQQIALTAIPAAPIKTARQEVPAAKNSVRLEHAVSVTDKLLSKNLGKSDRQELEKLKNTLAVLQIKGTLSPAESDILNENFNALLKLMAKYNV